MEVFSEPKIYGLSYQNEPENDLFLNVNFRQYPDMFNVYLSFYRKMNISEKQGLLLGSGFENTIKNILLALKPKSIFYNVPNWKMMDIFCKQFKIKKKTRKFKYEIKTNQFHEQQNKSRAEMFYTTFPANNYFKHTSLIDEKRMIDKFKYVIIDMSYASLDEMKYCIQKFRNNKKTILIGSFDKLYGCGLRLGFAIFDMSLNRTIMLYKERCLNSAACSIVINSRFKDPETIFLNKILKNRRINVISWTNNYFLVRDDNVNLILDKNIKYEKIKLGKNIFIKIGIPSNDEEYQKIIESIR